MQMNSSRIRIGILFHGNKIWLSEFVSIICVGLLLLTFIILSIIILQNEFTSHRNAKEITSLKSEKIHLDYEMAVLKEKNRIAHLLCKIVGSKLPAHTVFQLSELVYTNSKQYGYDPLLLLAVIRVESLFNPGAIGRFKSGNVSGAMGLMQIKLETAQEMADLLDMGKLTSDDLLKPEINLVLGVAYLAKLISRFKSFKLGLLAYNVGPRAVLNNLSRNEPLPLNYYKKVLTHYYKFQEFGQQLQLSESLNICN